VCRMASRQGELPLLKAELLVVLTEEPRCLIKFRSGSFKRPLIVGARLIFPEPSTPERKRQTGGRGGEDPSTEILCSSTLISRPARWSP
jgi:hypothetical protein